MKSVRFPAPFFRAKQKNLLAKLCTAPYWYSFLEKYDPLYPYQLSRFTGEAQLIRYLRRRVLGCSYAAVFQGGEYLWIK